MIYKQVGIHYDINYMKNYKQDYQEKYNGMQKLRYVGVKCYEEGKK